MKKLLIWAMTVVIVGLAAPAVARSSGPGAFWRDDECRYQSVERGRWTVYEVKLTIRCAVRHWPTDLDRAMYVADRESNFLYYARNPSSSSCGIYQSMPQLWPARQDSVDRALPGWGFRESCFGARVNVVWAIRYAHFYGWGPWGF